MLDSTFIIAEAGVNHNGSLQKAIELVDIAAEAGADAVKFQTFKAETVVSKTAPKAGYQIQHTGSDTSQWEMLKALELPRDSHFKLKEHCERRGIEFMSTPFDEDSAQFLLNQVQVKRLKVASGEITNAPLLLRMAQGEKPIILSSGVSTLGDLENALGVIAFGYLRIDRKPSRREFETAYASREGQALLREKVTLLHCTSEYPASADDINLRAMDTMRAAFGLPVGLSDHSQGIAIPIAAVARGAAAVEKHFTLDRKLPGPDHQASLEPQELKAMVRAIRDVERALGCGSKLPSPSEYKNRSIIRRSLVAAKAVKKGDTWNTSNLTAKRPGIGLSPFEYWDQIGHPALRDYEMDEPLA